MVEGATDLQLIIAARICAGISSALNWSGKQYSIADFMPSDGNANATISAKEALTIIRKQQGGTK